MDPSETLIIIAVLLAFILVELGAILVRLNKQVALAEAADKHLAYQSERLRELVIGAKLPEQPRPAP